jgi:hypothetical protein
MVAMVVMVAMVAMVAKPMRLCPRPPVLVVLK